MSPPPLGNRRRLPWLVVGALVVAGCALAFTLVSLRVGAQHSVLALTRPVPVGHVLTAQDVTTVEVAAEPRVSLVRAAERSQVVGRTVAVPLAKGALLTEHALGRAAFPPTGKAVVGVAVTPGRYPPGVTRGSRVEAVFTRSDTSSAPSGTSSPKQAEQPGAAKKGAVIGTVLRVRPSPADQSAKVVSLLVPADAARRVADVAAQERVSLVQLSPGG